MPLDPASSQAEGNAQEQDTSQCASPSSYLGLTNTISPRGTPKTVSVSNQPEMISPLMLGNQKSVEQLDLDHGKFSRHFPVSAKRLSARISRNTSPILRPNSLLHHSSELDEQEAHGHGHHLSHRHLDLLIDQVAGWIKEERHKRIERKQNRKFRKSTRTLKPRSQDDDDAPDAMTKRRGSDSSASSFDLEKLEDILKTNLHSERRHSRTHSLAIRSRGSARRLYQQSVVSSDTDHFDNEVLVPSCQVVLDNSKTLSYAGGASDDSEFSSGDELSRSASYRDQDAWAKFKFEIVRLAHTLRLKGWRRVPMDMSGEVTVQRLSGALTNAVYVVSPPEDLPPHKKGREHDQNGNPPQPKKPPPKLLLRIYGPQVEHLIDRESELAILRRLAKKKIGPSVLGTFANGRFEQYFYAKPLTAEELRNPDTSRQIAKRMRELHDGVDLLDDERASGPFVWRNWDKWVPRVEQIVSWLDREVKNIKPGEKPTGDNSWKRRGFICGVPWPQFQAVVDKYRCWLQRQYGSSKLVQEQLVFAHNDTQYGNILRMMPTGDSPLLLPANTHKQLVVIDFEYANANTPGLEFANHFTEWGYNYHDTKKPYAFHVSRYPTTEEQERFIRAYVRHRPQFNVSTPNLTPTATPTPTASSPSSEMLSRRPTSSIGEFILDARAPTTGSQVNEDLTGAAEKAAKAAEDQEVARLMHETRLWRLANTAQWVAWGIVQAKVPGMPQFSAEQESERTGEEGANRAPGESAEESDHVTRKDWAENGNSHDDMSAPKGPAEKEGEEAEDEFDYLGYAQHRALFFWADAVEMGIVKGDTLPEELRAKLKVVAR